MTLDREQLILLSRLKKNQDGVDLINEILIPLLSKNHDSILGSAKDGRDELVGYGQCLNDLIKIFVDCENKLSASSKLDMNKDWAN